MKTITLNFDVWNNGADTLWLFKKPRFRKTYKRIYFKNYIWTPFVIVNWKHLK